jgi:hypothetical protein
MLLRRIVFTVLFVVLAAGLAATPAEAQEQCYDLVRDSCTYETIQRCRSCMDAHCDRQRLDCLAFEPSGTPCDANHNLCQGDGITRCQSCGNEDHGTGCGIFPWFQCSQTEPQPTDAAPPRALASLTTISRLIFDLGLSPGAACAYLAPPEGVVEVAEGGAVIEASLVAEVAGEVSAA